MDVLFSAPRYPTNTLLLDGHLAVVRMLLLLSGDVELNPGPLGMLLTLADLEDIELELASVVDKWFDFGVQLNVEANLLNGIRKDYSDPAVCLHQVLIEWMMGRERDPSWEKIAVVLESPVLGEPELAEELREKFCKIEEPPPEDEARRRRRERPRPQGCGIQDCNCDNLTQSQRISSMTGLPYLNTTGLHEGEQQYLKGRLLLDYEEMMFAFQHLVSATWKSLNQQATPPEELVEFVASLEAFDSELISERKPLYSMLLKDLREAETIEEIFIGIHEYFSLFNYQIMEDMLTRLGRGSDYHEVEKYREKFNNYARRRVIECPPLYAPPSRYGHACIVIKLSLHPEVFTLHKIEKLRRRISHIFRLSKYSLRLIYIEKEEYGMLHTYQVPSFLRALLFPLSEDQKVALRNEGVMDITCCNYSFSAEELGPWPSKALEPPKPEGEEEEQEEQEEEEEIPQMVVTTTQAEESTSVSPMDTQPSDPPPTSSDPTLEQGSKSDPEPSPKIVGQNASDYQLRCDVLSYHHKFAQIAFQGKNYVFHLPSDEDTVITAGMIISNHIRQKMINNGIASVIFLVNSKARAHKQAAALRKLMPKANISCYTGTEQDKLSDEWQSPNDVTKVVVCTACKLDGEFVDSLINFYNITLLIVDECHLACKVTSLARIMQKSVKEKLFARPTRMPQVLGITAAKGAGANTTNLKEMSGHLVTVCGAINAMGGIRTHCMMKNLPDLAPPPTASSPQFRVEEFKCHDSREAFVACVTTEMSRLEHTVGLTCPYERWSQEYNSLLQHVKSETGSRVDLPQKDKLSVLELLQCYSRVLTTRNELSYEDAINVLQNFQISDKVGSGSTKQLLSHSLEQLKLQLAQLPRLTDPTVKIVTESLHEQFQRNPNAKGILFTCRRSIAFAVSNHVSKALVEYQLRPQLITIHDGKAVKKVLTEHKTAIESFREGKSRLLVISMGMDGIIDVPPSHFVMRLHHAEARTCEMNEYHLTTIFSNSIKTYAEYTTCEQDDLMREAVKYFPTSEQLPDALYNKQQQIIVNADIKLFQIEPKRHKKRKSPAAEHIRLKCKKCMTFACQASDLFTVFVDGSRHFVVPDEDFKVRMSTKPNSSEKDPKRFVKTHAVFCGNCNARWGSVNFFPAKGFGLPVLKSKHFLFELNGKDYKLKMWSDAAFYIPPMSACPGYHIHSSDSTSDSD